MKKTIIRIFLIISTTGSAQRAIRALPRRGALRARRGGRARLHEFRPRGMAAEVNLAQIVHGGAAQPAVAEDEAARLYDIDSDAQAGRRTHHGAGILRDIGLVEGEAHSVGHHDGNRGLLGACIAGTYIWTSKHLYTIAMAILTLSNVGIFIILFARLDDCASTMNPGPSVTRWGFFRSE